MIEAATQYSAEALREAMNMAFSDYAVSMKLTPEIFGLMTHTRGYVSALSRVAKVDNQIAAFWLVGAHEHQAYLISSGTVPAFRRRGLSRDIGQSVIAGLRAAGFTSLRTEVLDVNPNAQALYRQLGFTVRRDLDCYALTSLPDLDPRPEIEIKISSTLPTNAATLWDITPSWQNAPTALLNAGKDTAVITHHDASGLAAYAAIVPAQNNLSQLAVRSDRRRNGLATHLLAAARTQLGLSALRIINVDHADSGVAAFLRASGAQPTVGQKELWLDL